VHNHPSGDPTPIAGGHPDDPAPSSTSRGRFGISVHDHIIVGKNGHASFEGIEADVTVVHASSQRRRPAQSGMTLLRIVIPLSLFV